MLTHPPGVNMISNALVANDGSADVTYTKYSVYQDEVRLVSDSHSDKSPHYVRVIRKNPTKTPEYFGNRRTSVILVDTVAVDTPKGVQTAAPIHVELIVRRPVGSTKEDLTKALKKVSALAAHTDILDAAYDGSM